MTPPPPDDDEDFGSMLAEFEREQGKAPARKALQVGDVVRARITSIGREAAFVELGAKAEGMIELAELRDERGALTVAVGDQIEAHVIETADRAGCVVLRRSGLGRGPAAKAELEQAAAAGLPVEGVVTGVNKGGVEVQVAGVRGFCPISQLELRHVEDAAAFVGQRLTFRITKYETAGSRADLVLSRRALLEEERARAAATTREQLAVGAVLRGVVSSLKEYGAFVDLGGVEGMIHVSELGFARVARPSEVLSVGQPVEVQVLRIEGKGRDERIALSLKALEKDPWAEVEERFPPGRRLVGKVVRVEQFGAFVELAQGVEGLLHVSELAGMGGAKGQLRHAKDVCKVGDSLEVIVQKLEPERRRISLALAAKADELAVDAEGAAKAKAPVKLGTLGDLLQKAGAAAGAGKKEKKK